MCNSKMHYTSRTVVKFFLKFSSLVHLITGFCHFVNWIKREHCRFHTTSSNPVHARCTGHNIMWYSLSVTWGRSSAFFHQENWPPRYNWNIVVSGVKLHNPKHWKRTMIYYSCYIIEGRTYVYDDGCFVSMLNWIF